MQIRINKFLAAAGFGSRRGVEILVEKGQVKINNRCAKLSDKINPEVDIVLVNNKIIKPRQSLVYYAINKPVGYTSTVRDVYAQKLVTNLVPKTPRVFPVGRLDRNSHGLMILTNDGDLANRLTHPKFRHEKEYEVKIKSQFPISNIKRTIEKLIKGVRLEEGLVKADQVEIIRFNSDKNMATLKIILHQGLKRQIRRMCERVKLSILDLKRIRIGKLILDDLPEGKYKSIKKEDIL